QKISEPEPSCVSMRSDGSIWIPVNFNTTLKSVLLSRSVVTEPICKNNDQSMNQLQDFNESTYPGFSHEVLSRFRSNLTKKFGCLYEGTTKQGNPTLLNEIYTELYITESESGEINNEHEVRQIETQLSYCGVTDEGCAVLASALRSNPSHLRELNLSWNKLKDSGVNLLSTVLENPHCKLEILWLRYCGVTDEGCAALASALRSNPSHLRRLDLSDNKIEDSGVTLLCSVLSIPQCKLEMLWLSNCGFTDEGCAALASALRSNPSHLSDLNLSGNNLPDSGVLLSAVLEDLHCKLEKLWLCCSGFSSEIKPLTPETTGSV
ncbi:Ribonuclease inhibitor, partial [Anabarilius grahami]